MRKFDKFKMGIRMSEIRNKSGKSMEDFARKLGVTRNTIYNYENGNTTPSCEYLFEFSKLTGVSIDYIVMGHDLVATDYYVLSLYRKASEKIKKSLLNILEEFN